MTEDASDGEQRSQEVWTYLGRREVKGKKYNVWRDGSGEDRYYGKLSAATVGGRYAIEVSRTDSEVTVYPGLTRYTGEKVDEATRREWEATDIAAAAVLAAQALDRNDARSKALDEAIEPLAEIAAKLRMGPERDAFLAYVIRRLSQRW